MESRDLLTAMSIHHAILSRIARPAGHFSHAQAVPSAPAPTPHEKVRESFDARFQGPFTTGPGRFTNEALLTFVKGGGTSNQFLHGDVLIKITTPKDPTQPVTGTAELLSKTVATSGTILVLDLTGRAPANPLQPPGHLTWTVSGSSSGTYTNATGQGTLDLIYFPGGKRPQRAFQAGTAGAVFHGQVNTTGVGNYLILG
jgi:hypothetical protein